MPGSLHGRNAACETTLISKHGLELVTTNSARFTAVLRHWLRIRHGADPAPQELADVKRDILRPRSHDNGQHSGEGTASILERLQQK